MLPSDSPDRIRIVFDDHRLVANAGLLLPITLAHHLGLDELVDRHVDLGDAPGHASAGDNRRCGRITAGSGSSWGLASGVPSSFAVRGVPSRSRIRKCAL